MNIIDRVVGWFDPRRGLARMAWRDELRHYDAGDDSRLNANWRAINTSAEMTDRYSRDTVRARSRDLERNSDMLNAVIGAFGRNIVGGGFNLQAETGDTDLNQQIEKLWAQWCKKRNCDVTATQSFSQMMRMAVRRKKVDGGMLFIKRYTPDGILPFKLQAMEVDELDSSTIVAKHKGNRVCGGVEYNIDFTYYTQTGSGKSALEIQAAVNAAVQEYVRWQDTKLGRDINPDELRERLYHTGVKRIELREPSFTRLLNDGRSAPQVAQIKGITVTNGGYEDE